MAYVKKNWKNNDTITASALNNIENGVSSVDAGKQDKTDNALATTDKTVVGAINEIHNKVGSGQGADLSNYYDKASIDTKLSEKQSVEDSNLQTTSKNIVGAINEVNSKVGTNQGGSILIDDTSPSEDKVFSSKKVQTELSKKVNSSTYNSKIEELQPKTDPLLATDSKDIVQAINTTYELAKQASGGSSSVDVSNLITKQDIVKTDNSLAIPLGQGQLKNGSYSISVANTQNPVTVGSDTVFISGRQIPKAITNVPSNSVFINSTPQAEPKAGGYNVSIGSTVRVSGKYSTGVGAYARAEDSGTSLGYYAKADEKSIAIGYEATATGNQYYKDENISIGYQAGKFMNKWAGSQYYSGNNKKQCLYIGANAKTNSTGNGVSTNENVLGCNANGKGDNTFVLGDTSITGLYCQATQITQSCDPRLKENIEDVDVAQVIDALMQIKVIRASYRNLQEFKGSNENDKHKLMWDANNMSNIPLFAKDVKAQDMIITPLNENGEYLKTRTVTVTEQQSISTLNEDGEEHIQLVDVEVEKEIPETETIEECKEFTPNQIMQALVVGFQEQQKMILQLQEKIKKLESKS